MITSNNNTHYIESQNIRVFPCAYRGYYNDDTPLVFDPEARATTEANFTNTFHKLSNNKESYVVAWVPDFSAGANNSGTLKCVIGGYYFEIYNHEMSNFFYSEGNETKPYYLCIKTESITLGTSSPDETDIRTTTVLGSFANSTNYLDIEDQGKYAFTGLLISTTADGDGTATASLAPFMQGTGFFKINTKPAENEKIGKYYGTEDTTILTEITNDNVNQIPTNAQFYVKSESYTINSAVLPITNLLDVGSGKYSLRMIEDITEQGTNTTVASGDYSISLGLSTAATGKASTALGNDTKASAKGAFAAGNNTEASGAGAVALGSDTTASGTNAVALGNTTAASGANAVALGSHTKAEADNQVIIGTYNEKDDNQAFIIANGTATAGSNKFTVSKAGDVKALGTLETKGSIKATSDSTNDLELGTSAEGSSGSIKVYGAAADPIFSVENSGNTTIEGTTTISGATTITNATGSTSATTGALKVAGGVGIAKNLNVGGSVDITKNLNVNGELSVATDKATTLGGSLTTKGNTELQGTLITKLETTLEDALHVKKLASLEAGAKITGNVEITGNATSAKTTEEDADDTLTTKSYVDAAKTASNSYTDTKIQDLDFASNEIVVTKTANGGYLQTIEQVNGKIAATKANFATTFDTIDNLNTPTTYATDKHIKDVVSNLWTDKLVKESNTATERLSLQALIFDAIYPIGSIYMQYLTENDAAPQECPLQKTLTGSTWAPIEGGRFLISVGATAWGETIYKDTKGGSPHATLIGHTHEYTNGTISGGEHQHMVAFRASKVGIDEVTGFEGNSGDSTAGYVIENTLTATTYKNIKDHAKTLNADEKEDLTEAYGAHEHTLPSITKKGGSYDGKTFNSDSSATGKNANLPPYIAVYMWRRTK